MNNTISIRCNLNNLQHVRVFVTSTLSPYPLSAIVLNQMILAVDEICANLIVHGNAEDDTKFLHLTVVTRPGNEFLFEIADSGKPFLLYNYKEPDIREHVENGRGSGLGIALVLRIMDKVEFTSNGSRNVCRLYKKVKKKE
ncbi:hypothetical protein BH24BAC1_BH24BAC1_02380 [soil metagenome]